MMNDHRCIFCGTMRPIVGSCPECLRREQAERLIEQNNEAERQRSRDAYDRQRLQEQQLEIQRQALDEQRFHNSVMAEERQVDDATALVAGSKYVNDFWKSNNYLGMKIWVVEGGSIAYEYKKPYLSDRLNAQFSVGVRLSFLSKGSASTEDLKSQAFLAGRQIAEGTLNQRFTLWSGVYIDGQQLLTESFSSNMKRTVDETDGTVTWNWTKPFKREELNDSFLAGANEVYAEQNTPEMKADRLNSEVPGIIAERKKQSRIEGIRRYGEILVMMACLVSSFLVPAILWVNEHGFYALLWAVISIFLSFVIADEYFEN